MVEQISQRRVGVFFMSKNRGDLMDALQEIATSQFVWAICCIAFVVWTTKTSKAREDKLMEHLDRSNISQERTATALQSMEGRMDRMEKVIYSDVKKYK